MAGMRLTVKGLRGATRRTQKRANKMKQLRSPMKRSIVDFLAVAQRNFDTSGRAHKPPDAWKRLAPSTLKQKARKRQSSMPLIAEGNLKGDWIVKADNPRRGEITSNARTRTKRGLVWYGIFHHKGGRHLPMRRFLIKLRHAQRVVAKHYGKHVVTSLKVT